MSGPTVEQVSRVMEHLLANEGRAVVYHDRAVPADLLVSPAVAASPAGLLPAFVVAGEAIWREATGKGFALSIVHDPRALLGYRLESVGAGSLGTVMLATMEATAQASRAGAVVINELHAVWAGATQRIDNQPQPAPRVSAGAAP